MSTTSPRLHRALFRLPVGVIRLALIVRVLDEWWSYLPAGTIDDQHRDLGLSYARSGWLLALLTVGGLVASPLSALADRGHRRALATTGAAVLAAGLAAFAAGAPFPVLALAALACGGASDLVIVPLEASLAETGGDDLPRLLGRQHLFTWLGDLIGPALLVLGAGTALGWRGAFAVTAAVYAGFALVLAATTFPVPGAGDEDGEEAGSWLAGARELIGTPEILLLVGAEMLFLALDETFLGFVVARLAAAGGAGAGQAVAVGLVAGGVAGAAAVARWGIRRRLTRVGAVALVAGAALAAPAGTVGTQVVGMTLVGVGTALAWARVHHRTLTVVPGRAAMVSTVVGALATPAVVLPVVMGTVADRMSITVAVTLGACLALPLALIVIRLGGADPAIVEDAP